MIRLVWRNLTRNKRRTILTIGSVALALFLLSLLGAVLQAMTDVSGSSEARRLVARNAISLTFQLPAAFGQRLKSLPGVVEVTPLNWFQGVYKDTRPENFFPRFASDPDTLFEVFPEIQIPVDQVETWKRERDGFIAGRSLVERQGWELGDRITIQGDIYPVDASLVLRGVFEVPENSSQERILYFHMDYLEEALGNPGQVGTYWLLLEDPDRVPEVIQAGEAMFENSVAPVRVETEEAFGLAFVQMLGNIRFLFGSIGLAIVVSILLISANTMAMAARERTREAAVLRTIGFPKTRVVAMVVIEALFVGLAGAALGMVAAAFLLRGLDPMLQELGFVFQGLAMTPQRLLTGVAIGLAIGLLSGAFPAVAAARMRIVDGLRRV